MVEGEPNILTRDDDGGFYLTENDSNYRTAVLGFNHPNNYSDQEILDEFVFVINHFVNSFLIVVKSLTYAFIFLGW